MKRELTITHVLWKLDRAGAERAIVDMLALLARQGHAVSLIACVPGGVMAEEIKASGIKYVEAPIGSRRGLVKFLRQQIRETQPDVWHTHLGGDFWGGYAALRERHPCWVATLQNIDHNLPWSFEIARRFMYSRVRHLVCLSGSVSEHAEQAYGVAGERRSVIPSGLNLERVVLRSSHLPSDTPKLITVGRLVPQKDQATLLRALSRVRRAWQLDIVGDGPERLALQRIVESLGILPRVRFTGNVADVPARLATADIFLFPSRWEGQGIALLEAAAAGLPFIASDLPVFREMFDETAGRYAPVGDVGAWSRALESLLSDPAAAQSRAQAARRIVRERYTIERMAESHLALYSKLLYAHPAR